MCRYRFLLTPSWYQLGQKTSGLCGHGRAVPYQNGTCPSHCLGFSNTSSHMVCTPCCGLLTATPRHTCVRVSIALPTRAHHSPSSHCTSLSNLGAYLCCSLPLSHRVDRSTRTKAILSLWKQKLKQAAAPHQDKAEGVKGAIPLFPTRMMTWHATPHFSSSRLDSRANSPFSGVTASQETKRIHSSHPT